MSENLTPRKLEILRLINEFTNSQHYSPTIQELASLLRKSRTTVFEHCAVLQEKGLLSTSQGKARSLKLTHQAIELLESLDQSPVFDPNSDSSGLPLLGSVAAGVAVEAFARNDKLSLETQFSGKDVFSLEVSGLSMIEENIAPGDYVICKKTSIAKDGDLVIALVNDTETTLKRFFKEKDFIRLQPANKDYEPIITTNCKIQAQVIGLVKKF